MHIGGINEHGFDWRFTASKVASRVPPPPVEDASSDEAGHFGSCLPSAMPSLTSPSTKWVDFPAQVRLKTSSSLLPSLK